MVQPMRTNPRIVPLPANNTLSIVPTIAIAMVDNTDNDNPANVINAIMGNEAVAIRVTKNVARGG